MRDSYKMTEKHVLCTVCCKCNTLSARASFSAPAILCCLLRAVIQVPMRPTRAPPYVLYLCKLLRVVNGSGISHGPQSATHRPRHSPHPHFGHATACLTVEASAFGSTEGFCFLCVCVSCVCVVCVSGFDYTQQMHKMDLDQGSA